MNLKRQQIHNYQQLNLKTKTTNKQKTNKTNQANNQNRNRIIGMEIIWRSSSGRGKGENGGRGAGIKKHNWKVQNRMGDVKNNIGNVKSKNLYAVVRGKYRQLYLNNNKIIFKKKELTCMTHGHELREEYCWKEWWY